MSGKTITPTLGSKSFSCPHCGAIAHQTWYCLFVEGYEKDSAPWLPEPDLIRQFEEDSKLPDEANLLGFLKRKLAKEIFRQVHPQWKHHDVELISLYVSLFYSCDKYAVWVADGLIYPPQPTSIQPDEEMPDEIRRDFLEAASIVDKSARGAAALLRLCIQKLMVHLELKGKNIDDDIGALVKRGLDARIQKALDVVRVVGNNAVHPGQIDLRDDNELPAGVADPPRMKHNSGLVCPPPLSSPRNRGPMNTGLWNMGPRLRDACAGTTEDLFSLSY